MYYVPEFPLARAFICYNAFLCGWYTTFLDGLKNFVTGEDKMGADRSIAIYNICLTLFLKLQGNVANVGQL